MAAKALPSPEVLRQLLRYEPDTGKLFWLPRGPEWFTGSRSHAIWNTRFPGHQAFNTPHNAGYLYGRIFNQIFLTHRIAWTIFHGSPLEDQIDHINGDRKDNRIANLRSVSHRDNMRNMRIREDNSSGFTGIYRHSETGKWVAQIKTPGCYKYLGCFDELAAAVETRRAAEEKLGFHRNHGKR